MKKQLMIFCYSIALSFTIIYASFNNLNAEIANGYPLFKNNVVYGLSSDYSQIIGSKAPCNGISECAKIFHQTYKQNSSIAHVVIDPIQLYHDGQRCENDEWRERNIAGYIWQTSMTLTAALFLTSLRTIYGILEHLCKDKVPIFVALFLLVGEKIVMWMSALGLAEVKMDPFAGLVFGLPLMDLIIHLEYLFSKSKQSQLSSKV